MVDTLRILYVDDEPDLLDIGKLFLEKSGDFTVTTILSAPEALRLLEQERFDAIISDYQMPDMDGIQFLVEVRTRFGPLPFILFTGRGREEVVIQAINKGADFYLQKGGNPHAQFAELANHIKQAASRKRADEALIHSHDLMRYIIEHNRSAVAVHDRDLKYLYVSQCYLQDYKVKECDVIGKHHYDVFPDLPQKWRDAHQKALAGEISSAENDPYVREDGTVDWTRWECRPWYEADGSIGGIIVYTEVITERKRVEEALQLKDFAIESSINAIAIADLSGNLTDVNPAFLSIWGYELRQEVLGRSVLSFWKVPNDAQQVIDGIKAQGTWSGEMTGQRKDGTPIPVQLSANLIRDVAGTPVAMMGSFIDITKRKRVEEALAESESFNRGLVENLPDYIVVYGSDGKILYVNPAAARLLGFDADKLVGTPLLLYIAEEYRDEVVSRIAERRKGGEVSPYEIELILSDGRQRTVIVKGSPIQYHDNPVVLLLLIDITERKQVEEELQFKNIILSTQQETAPDGILVVDSASKVLSYNRKFIDIWNIPPELLKSTGEESILQFAVGQVADPGEFLSGIRYLYEHKDEKSFEEVLLRDGRVLERFSAPVLGGTGKYYGRVWYFRDISERIRAQESLWKINQKLNVLSGLTRKELTNQVFVLNSYLDLVKKSAEGQESILENIQKCERAARSISEITEFTKNFQDMGARPAKWQNVKTALLLGLSHISIGEIQHSIETEDLEIFADPLLEDVCQHLFENSFLHGEHVTRIRVWHTATPRGVTIFFEDDGTGIPQEKKEQIFVRGGTVNRASMRSLIFVREILDITGITITETGEPGKGARFEMAVPKGAWRIAGNGA